MNREFFNSQMVKIRSAYGDKFYNEQRIIAIWKLLQHLEDETFSRVCNKLINAYRIPPLPKDFVDTAREIMPRGEYKNLENKPTVIECQQCADSCVVQVEHKKTQQRYFVKCDCWEKRSQPPTIRWKIPIINDTVFLNYVVRPFDVSECVRWRPGKMKNFDQLVAKWKDQMQRSEKHWSEVEQKDLEEIHF